MMPASIIHFMANGGAATPFTERLHAALAKAVSGPPPADDLFDFVLTEFENEDFEYAHALLAPTEQAWYTVYFGPASSELALRGEGLFAAQGQVQALSFALAELDRERELPSDVKVTGETIELHRAGGLLLRIAPIVFEPPNAIARRRIESDLKGLRQYGAEAHICARLSDVPGLEHLCEREFRGTRRADNVRQPFGAVISKSAGSIAAGLRKGLSERFGLQIKQSQVQEILAECVGASNWAHLVAREAEPLCWTMPSAVGRAGATDESAYRFYRTAAEGIWGFAQALRQYPQGVLAPPTWGGKASSGHGVYMHTGLQATPLDEIGMRDDEIWLHTPSTADDDPVYDEIAKSILSDPQKAASELANYLGLKAPTEARISAASRRLGVAHDAAKLIGEWLFTFRSNGSTAFLHAERFDHDGRLLEHHSTAAYKAEIQYDADTKKYLIAGDYARRIDIPLPGFSPNQVRSLSDFCEGRMDHRVHRVKRSFLNGGYESHAES